MVNPKELDLRRLNVANNTANHFLTELKIDKTRAIDTYDIAKKIGLNYSNLSDFLDDNISKSSILNDNKTANRDRFILARAIAKYIVLSALPNTNFKDNNVKMVLDDLAMSIVIPNKEASRIYRQLKATNISDDIIATKISNLYGVDKTIANVRLDQLKAEENLKYVS